MMCKKCKDDNATSWVITNKKECNKNEFSCQYCAETWNVTELYIRNNNNVYNVVCKQCQK
jgi:hypothetical protein